MRKIEKPRPHPKITQKQIVEFRPSFPISWLHKQDYCEYQIFIENIKKIKIEPTKAMIEGTKEHERLESEFLQRAKPATFAEMLKESETEYVLCRELSVLSLKYGIRGLIDEIHLRPNEFVIIDDKPGTKTYLSMIHQVYGYCLAFKEMVKQHKSRPIVAALRERGTDNIYWKVPFDEKAENEIVKVINHIHGLISGTEQFNSSKNPNKCKPCRFKNDCDRVISS
ncbi:MAG: Dna2/Cas4 domain-containing protein [Candidatus Methanoperedens sp.]